MAHIWFTSEVLCGAWGFLFKFNRVEHAAILGQIDLLPHDALLAAGIDMLLFTQIQSGHLENLSFQNISLFNAACHSSIRMVHNFFSN